METKDIDLTKCRGLAFKAKIHDVQCEGRIQVERDVVFLCQDSINGAECQDTLGFKYSWGILDGSKEDMKRNHVTDFEIVPRDPETCRDWQVGDRATVPNEKWNDSAYKEIIFRSGELVICKDGNGDISGGYTCGQLHRLGYRLVLTDIEQQIIEEKNEYKPQDGDICFVEASDGYCSIFIYKNGFHRTNYYASLDTDTGCSTILFTDGGYVVANSKITVLRPATEEERQKLFDAMAKEGKRWNAEKKVVEDIPKPYEFKKGEPVLVRADEFHRWIIAAYTSKDELGFIANAGVSVIHWKYCLPYNEKTMHLLGTKEDYKEEQI